MKINQIFFAFIYVLVLTSFSTSATESEDYTKFKVNLIVSGNSAGAVELKERIESNLKKLKDVELTDYSEDYMLSVMIMETKIKSQPNTVAGYAISVNIIRKFKDFSLKLLIPKERHEMVNYFTDNLFYLPDNRLIVCSVDDLPLISDEIVNVYLNEKLNEPRELIRKMKARQK